MKKEFFGMILVFVMSMLIFVACGEKVESTAGATPKPTSESTSETAETVTPELEPTPVEEFIELSEDEITELHARAIDYGRPLFYTAFIVEYYKYIGMEELEVPVIVCCDQRSEAEEYFGGEWEYIPNTVVVSEEKEELFGKYSTYFNDLFNITRAKYHINESVQKWFKGKLTISEVERELSLKDGRIYIINDYSVESSYANDESRKSWFPPLRPFSEYMRWLRHFGHYTVDEYEDEEGIHHLYIDNRHLFFY